MLATVILLGAAFLRLADLHRYPPGLHYDEAVDLLLSRDIAWAGYRPFPVVPVYSGREVLFYYLAAPLVRVIGSNVMATRLTSAFLGILAIAATIALGKAMLRDRIVALMAGAWLAVSGPEIWLSRQGFRTSPQPFLEGVGLWLLWVCLRRTRGWLPPAILAGVFSGLALYVYIAARIFPPWLLIPLAALLLTNRGALGLRLRQAAVFLVTLGITALPLAVFYLAHPDIFADRLVQVTTGSNTPTLLESIVLHLQMFFLSGDPILRYNLSVGRPFFDPVSGVLLLIGLGIAAWWLFSSPQPLAKTAAAFMFFCPLLIIPSVVAVGGYPPSHMRSVAMVPLIFFLPALAASKLIGRTGLRPVSLLVLSALLFGGVGLWTWRDYEAWGTRADVFYDSDGDLNLAATWLEKSAPPDSLIYFSSKFYDDPTVQAHESDPQRLRWMMEDHLILPPPDRAALYVFPRSVTAEPWLKFMQAGRMEDLPLGPDGAPAFEAFRFAPGELRRPTPTITLDANVAGILRLVGADLPPAAAGQRAVALLYWEVLRAPERNDLGSLISLVDNWDNEIARVSPYFDASARWLPGEWIIQRVELNIPVGNPPGNYTIKAAWVGKFSSNDYLPLVVGQGYYAGNWAVIKPLSVSVGGGAPGKSDSRAVLPGIYEAGISTFPTALLQGEHLRFTVTWYAGQATASDKPLKLVAKRADSETLSTLWLGQPVHDTYPMTKWMPGETVIDRYDIPIPPDFPPGQYQISMTLDGALQPVFSVPIQIVAQSREFTIPKLAHMGDWRFGESISLVGYEVQKAGDGQVTVRLAWQARSTPDRDYTVFVHLVNPDGSIFSQRDSQPSRPTSQWINGEVVTDTYTLPTPPGSYTVKVGLYLQDNGLRLSVSDANGSAAGDEVELGAAS